MTLMKEDGQTMELEAVVRECLGETLRLSPETRIGADENLAAYGFDSLSCMELVIMLEKRLNCSFPYEYLVMEDIDTVDKICRVLTSSEGEEADET